MRSPLTFVFLVHKTQNDEEDEVDSPVDPLKQYRDKLDKNPDTPIAWTQGHKLHVMVPDDAVLVCPHCFAEGSKKYSYKFSTYGQQHGPICNHRDKTAVKPVLVEDTPVIMVSLMS